MILITPNMYRTTTNSEVRKKNIYIPIVCKKKNQSNGKSQTEAVALGSKSINKYKKKSKEISSSKIDKGKFFS